MFQEDSIAMALSYLKSAVAALSKDGGAVDDANSLQLIRSWADQGDAAAQRNLGVMHHQGQGAPQNDAEAMKWYHLAAEQGDAIAQDMLGVMYADRKATPQSFFDAIKLSRLASEEGQAVIRMPDYEAEAQKWYRLAADQGYVYAQHKLGFMYFWGRGLPRNRARARKWLRLAANQGYAEAWFLLGLLNHRYRRRPDKVQAYMWYTLAAAQDEESSLNNLPHLKKEMTRAEIAEGERLVRNWKSKMTPEAKKALGRA